METKKSDMLSLITYLIDNGYGKSKTLWGVAYALGHPITAGMTVIEAARYLQCSRQSLHSHISNFKKFTGYDEVVAESDFAYLDKTTQQTK